MSSVGDPLQNETKPGSTALRAFELKGEKESLCPGRLPHAAKF